MYGRPHGGHDEQRGEGDHDPVGEVVDVKEERHVPDADQDERLQEGVGHVELHATPEHNLNHGLHNTQYIVHSILSPALLSP